MANINLFREQQPRLHPEQEYMGDKAYIRPIHKFVSQAVQRLQRISLRLFQVERIYLGRRNQGLSIVPISN